MGHSLTHPTATERELGPSALQLVLSPFQRVNSTNRPTRPQTNKTQSEPDSHHNKTRSDPDSHHNKTLHKPNQQNPPKHKPKQASKATLVPSLSMGSESDMERILYTESEISDRISALAGDLSASLRSSAAGDGGGAAVFVGVATGAFLFLADLVRRITVPICVDFVRVESYGSGTESCGEPRISCELKVDVSGKHVVLVEDIVDTGNTLSCLISYLEKKGVSSVSVCTLLDKPARRKVQVKLVGDGKFYRGFECPDYFVVGYGMDFAELYRNLPYVGVLKPKIYKNVKN